MQQAQVEVKITDRSYNIHIGSGLIDNITQYLPLDISERSCFVVTDTHVKDVYAEKLVQTLQQNGSFLTEMYVLPAGEQSKSFSELEKILSWLMESGVNRESIIFAVGGGVVGDIAGMAASLAMRGVSFVQVPTTLLAQVDSSVGGKTAINLPQGKNLAGTFYQPISVICDTDALLSLPDRALKAGYVEILKYALLGDESFFIWLESNGKDVCNKDPEAIIKAVEISCKKKAEIVIQDEKEHGVRAMLNFGHTFGHALELATNYDGRVLHGEAVSIGMVMAMRLSLRQGSFKDRDMDRILKHMENMGLPLAISDINPPIEKNVDEFIRYLKKDKKATSSSLVFILLKSIGNAYRCTDVNPDDIRAVIEHSFRGK